MKTVYTNGAWSVIRIESYGFRCNTATASWEIHFEGNFYSSSPTLKYAKKMIERNIEVGAPTPMVSAG